MARLEQLEKGAVVRGIDPTAAVTIIDVRWHGSAVVSLTFKCHSGEVDQRLLYRENEPELEVVTRGTPWNFQADGSHLRLASEAYRIHLAHLFDPMLAVHTSTLEPLPHQIVAVYEKMLPRQPLRYLLADDPGAGKTIMAGLFIKELLIRGDLQRCLICCPGNLADQWQDELWQRFQLNFDKISRQTIEDSKSGNPYAEKNLIICRLDQMSRSEEIQAKLSQTDWDLIVCDEAHKMSASFYSSEIKETKRYKLGRLLSGLTRHFLLMTATPHNGKEEDFQLFMALLDGDRFEGRFRDGVHVADTSDIMRRMVKEDLLKFDGKKLFPERTASTVNYTLSLPEAELYKKVTEYVREEFNRADKIENNGRKGTIGFALTILQRRLASSPEAIYQSIRRRKERLEKRLREEELLKRGADAELSRQVEDQDVIDDIEDFEDSPADELEDAEERIVDRATAARTIKELQAEIGILKGLESLALKVRRNGKDTKWEELSTLLHDNPEMFDSNGHRRKMVIFTEHRDTLRYLTDRIRTFIGKPEAVVTIHGSKGREDRKKAQESFTQDKEVHILVATDAAGEGINLQRAHLMVNYDLPWNPNRLEQRFGRIHRIGQTEVCHLWNLVAEETREGDVFLTLLNKLKVEREALGGGVFDVLGRVFQGTELRRLLIEAVRYGESPEVKARLFETVETAMSREKLKELLEQRALAYDSINLAKVHDVRREMERAEASRLQPHFVASFFMEAFKLLGGRIVERESKRYEITRVPASVRSRDREIGIGAPMLSRYERVTFEKELCNVHGKPMAELICPGHPLLDATIDLILERYRDVLRSGAVLVDPEDAGEDIRALFYLESRINDSRRTRSGESMVASRQLQFVEVDSTGGIAAAGYAPYLNYRPLSEEEQGQIGSILDKHWHDRDSSVEAESYAIEHLVPEHLTEVKRHRESYVGKTLAAVKERLTKEINYWDHRANQLKAQELAGKKPRLNSARARQRADELEARLKSRTEELEKERMVAPAPPHIVGGALIIPRGLIDKLTKATDRDDQASPEEKARIEKAAMDAVIRMEKQLGFLPTDIHTENRGYDIESEVPDSGELRFIEVKGRAIGKKTVTVTRNEILCGLNKPDQFILALGIVNGEEVTLSYVRHPFKQDIDFGVTSVNYDLSELLGLGEKIL